MLYVADITVKCPSCGTKFKSQQLPIIIDSGRRNSELRQDFKGVIPQFESYAVCTCPGCGQASWVNKFPTVEDADVQITQAQLTPHMQFRAAALGAESRNEGFWDVGQLFLHAAWCADDVAASAQAAEYRRLASNAFVKALIEGSCPLNQRMALEYLIGELHRRAGDFEIASAQLRNAIPKLSGTYALMARKLIRLAENNDSNAIDFDFGS